MMASSYYQNLIKRVLEASTTDNWEIAVREWDIVDCEEDEEHASECVCGKENLRYLFTIRNRAVSYTHLAITENMANQFFSMFWGRQDVYAKRSVNKETGKAAYYPQCNNFWTNVCHKKIKDGINCKDCKNRSYKTITKKDILNHLQGNAYNASDVIGVYPLLSNGRCV